MQGMIVHLVLHCIRRLASQVLVYMQFGLYRAVERWRIVLDKVTRLGLHVALRCFPDKFLMLCHLQRCCCEWGWAFGGWAACIEERLQAGRGFQGSGWVGFDQWTSVSQVALSTACANHV